MGAEGWPDGDGLYWPALFGPSAARRAGSGGGDAVLVLFSLAGGPKKCGRRPSRMPPDHFLQSENGRIYSARAKITAPAPALPRPTLFQKICVISDQFSVAENGSFYCATAKITAPIDFLTIL